MEKKDDKDKKGRPQHPALEIIEEAMKRGDFDNLPGKGKPLNLDSNELNDPLGFASKIRKNANIGTPWEERQREIEALVTRAERDLKTTHEWRVRALQRPGADVQAVEAQWLRALETFRSHVQKINSKILTFNLHLPPQAGHLYKRRIQVEEALERLGVS
jgi:DnaJ family protein C protein 28